MEALVALLLGLYLLSSSNVPHLFAGVAFGVGLVVLVLTLALGRKSRATPAEVPEKSPEPMGSGLPASIDDVAAITTQETLTIPVSLPESEVKQLAGAPHGEAATALAPTEDGALAPQGLLHDVVMRSRWRYRAREAETRAATLTELVLHEGSQGDVLKDDRPRQLRRLCDLAILSQGFEAWANGDHPSFQLERYAKAHSREDLHDRLGELRREKEVLQAESRHWEDTLADYDDPYRRSLAERMRFEKLRDLEERMEEIMLLEMGYDSMREEDAP